MFLAFYGEPEAGKFRYRGVPRDGVGESLFYLGREGVFGLGLVHGGDTGGPGSIPATSFSGGVHSASDASDNLMRWGTQLIPSVSIHRAASTRNTTLPCDSAQPEVDGVESLGSQVLLSDDLA